MDGPPYCLDVEEYDDLDEETQEDIEARLYGMIHHASNDEIYGKTNETSLRDQSSASHDLSDQDSCHSKNQLVSTISINSESKSESKSQDHGNNARNNSKCNSPTTLESESSILSKPKPRMSPGVEKFNSPKQTTTAAKLSRNPYEEYLVIEHSKKSRLQSPLKDDLKIAEVITISDDEDSRYQSINNKLSNLKQKRLLKNNATSFGITQSEEESETDDSIILLDTQPEENNLFSSSESSDSDIEIISKSSKVISITSELRLNTNSLSMSNAAHRIGLTPEVEGWERFCSKKWTPEMITFYSSAAAKVDLEGMMNSIPRGANWHLDREDRFGPDLQRNRYFAKAARMRCSNCNQIGHQAKACPDPRKIPCCVLCGASGHKMYACPKKICLSCGEPSKILIECCTECRKERSAVCMICRQKHVTTQCPDLWRRYHTTTSSEEPVPGESSLKPSRMLYCCNCAGRGHLPKDCPGVRWSKYPAVDPTIRSYENSRTFLESLTQNGNSSVTRSNDGSVWVIDNPKERSAKRTRHLKYYIPQENLSNEKQLQSAASVVMSEIKHVAVTWRMQKKKRRIVVEFDGNGNTHEARDRFKKAFTFSRNSGKAKQEFKNGSSRTGDKSFTENRKSGQSSLGTSSNVTSTPTKKNSTSPSKNKTPKITRGNSDYITELVINTVNTFGSANHRSLKVHLTQTDKRHLGKHLSKFEQKHHVTITSAVSGQKLEITIHSGSQRGHLSAALNAIIRCLDIMSKKPVNS